MARLFIKHEPVEAVVTVSPAFTVAGADSSTSKRFSLENDLVKDIELIYVCFVHEGKCYAGRSKSFHSSGTRCSIYAIPFEDNHCSRLMVLKDILLS